MSVSNVAPVSREFLQSIAIGEARGTTSITSYAIAFATGIAAGAFTADDTADVYMSRFAWVNAECAALGKDQMDVPTGNSLASQVSKFRSVADLGAWDHAGRSVFAVVDVLSDAAVMAKQSYRKVLSSAGAMLAVLAKNPGVSRDDLLIAALDAQTDKPKVLSADADFQKIAKLWDKLQGRVEYADVFQRVHARRAGTLDAFNATMTLMGKLIAFAEADAHIPG